MGKFVPASHEDWLEFRRHHVTSTEIAKLATARNSASMWKHLSNEKTTGQRSFTGNDATRWGTTREPLIALELQKIDSRLIYNADPQTVFTPKLDVWESENISCTPDMYSEDMSIIGEIKTASRLLRGGQYHEVLPDNYYLQCQMNLHVTGAEDCLFMVEYHDDFLPRETWWTRIGRDEKVIADLLVVALEFIAMHKDGVKPSWMNDGVEDGACMELIGLLDQRRELVATIENATQQRRDVEAKIMELTGTGYADTVGKYKVSVTQIKSAKVFDSAKFKKEHKDLYAEYCTKERAGSVRMTVKEIED